MAKKGENIYKRKDGRWEGRYIKTKGEDGKVQYGYIYRQSYTEVKQELNKQKAVYKFRLNPKEVYGGTVREWLEYWLASQKQKVRQSTFASYKNKLDIHVIPYLGDIRLNQLNEKHIAAWCGGLTNTLSQSSANAVVRVCKTALKEPQRKGYCSNYLFDELSFSKTVKKIEALTREERRLIVQASKQQLCYLPVLLALETGMRIGEISGLKWADVDFLRKQITVRRTLQRITADGNAKKTIVIETPPKSRMSERIIPISAGLAEHLRKVREAKTTDYVVAKSGKYLEPRTISYRFKKLQKELGLQPYPFHALRHTFATHCLEQGVNIAAISSLLGHSSIKMTLDVYTNSNLLEEHSAIERVTYL